MGAPMSLQTSSNVAYAIALIATLSGSQLVCEAGQGSKVGFDVPAVVVAQPVDHRLVNSPTGGGRFVRVRIPVSVFKLPGFNGAVTEYDVQLESPHQSMRIVDFWPRNAVYSNVVGNINVESATQAKYNVNAQVSAGFEPFVRGNGGGGYEKSTSSKESFQKAPEMEALTSSGTRNRGYGAFFKFHPGQTPSLEGAREIAFVAEVPAAWRADLIQISLRAVGKSSNSFGSTVLGSTRLWTTIHQEGDLAAAAQARRFVTQERSLRALAASQHDEIRKKSLPTIWHQIGAALDVVEPRIPDDYMVHVIYGPRNQYFEGHAHRLPIDLRVAILDYWDAREALTSLALGIQAGAG